MDAGRGRQQACVERATRGEAAMARKRLRDGCRDTCSMLRSGGAPEYLKQISSPMTCRERGARGSHGVGRQSASKRRLLDRRPHHLAQLQAAASQRGDSGSSARARLPRGGSEGRTLLNCMMRSKLQLIMTPQYMLSRLR